LSDNYVSKWHNFVIVTYSKYDKSDIYFCGKFIPRTSCKFYYDDVITTSLALWTQSVSAVFYRPVFFQTPQVLNSIASHAKMNKFNKQTFLNVKRQTVIFIFQHIFRIHFSIYPNYQQVCECLMKKRCWWLIVACMCKSLFINTFNFLHRTCIAGLSKHLSPYIGLISVRMVLALSPFGHKNWISERCSLQFSLVGNIAIYRPNVYKWHHGDVIKMKLIACI